LLLTSLFAYNRKTETDRSVSKLLKEPNSEFEGKNYP